MGLSRVDEHVEACRVNIRCEPGAEGIAFEDMDEHSHAAHDSAGDACGSQQRVELPSRRALEEKSAE